MVAILMIGTALVTFVASIAVIAGGALSGAALLVMRAMRKPVPAEVARLPGR